MDKRLTYFTPTYNRAHTLPKLYESMLSQTNKDFIWLIIDDGSKDNTEELVHGWIEEGKLDIEYIKKENGGKHTAIELSNQVCKTEYINCIDSDDYISEDSTEVLLRYLDEVSLDSSLCGIVARRAHYDGSPFNESFPGNPEKLFFRELATRFNYTQDTNLIFKTELIKQFHFPVFEDERFVTESVFYNQFILDYKMLAIPELLYLAEYQPDGYTAQGLKLFVKNPKGYLYSLKQDTCIACERKSSFKLRLFRASAYHAWKRTMKLKDDFTKGMKIPFIFNFGGWLCSLTILRNFYKKQLKDLNK